MVNTADFTYYESLILGLLLALVVLVFVYAFVRGLTRGWRYGLFRLAFFFVLTVIALICLHPIANSLGNMDLSSRGWGDISFTYNDALIDAPITTPYETIESVIAQTLKAARVEMAPDALENTAFALTQSALVFVVFLFDGIFLLTIGNLLAILLWHTLVIHWVPKEQRKTCYKKGKWISACTDGLIAVVCLTMMVAPLSSLANAASNNWHIENEENDTALKADNETYAVVSDAIATYDNSAFSKVFFSWSKQSDASFDENLMSFLSKTTIGGTSVSFIEEVASASDIVSKAVDCGALSQDLTTREGRLALISSEYMPSLLRSLSGSKLFCSVLPYGLNLVLSLDNVAAYLKTSEGISTTSKDWPRDLNALADLFEDLRNSEVVASLTQDETGAYHFEGSGFKSLFTPEYQTKFHACMDRISLEGNLALLNRLIASFVYVSACNRASNAENAAQEPGTLSLDAFLPTVTGTDNDGDGYPDAVPASFLEKPWGEEISTLYDVLYRLANVDWSFVGNMIDGAFTGSLDMPALSSLSLQHLKELSPIFVGDTDADGHLANVDETTGKSTQEACLLDSYFVSNALGSSLTQFASSLQDSAAVTVDLSDTITRLNGSSEKEKRVNYKTEVNTLFQVAEAFTEKPIGQEFLLHLADKPGLNYDPDGSLHSIDDDLLDCLISSLAKSDASLVMQKVTPALFSSLFTGDKSPFAGLGLPLQPSFAGEHLGASLSSLLATYKACQPLIRYASSLQNASSLSGPALEEAVKQLASYEENGAMLSQLLDGFASSPILNPAGVDEKGAITQNENYIAVLKKIVSSSLGESYAENIASLVNGDGYSYQSEDSALARVIVAFSSSGLADHLSDLSGGLTSLSVLDGVDLASLFAALGESQIMASSFASYLDDKLLPLIGSAEELGGASFRNIANWENEGTALTALIRAAVKVGDLSHIDFLHSDPTSVGQIVSALAKSQIFVEGDKYLFPDYFWSKFVSSVSQDAKGKTYFYDFDTPESYLLLKEDFEKLSTPAAWAGEGPGLGGESLAFSSLVRGSEMVDGFDHFSVDVDLRNTPPESYEYLFKALETSQAFKRVLTYHLYEHVIASFDTSGASLTGSNLAYLRDCSDAARDNELSTLSDILYVVLDEHYGFLDDSGHLSAANLALTSSSLNPDYALKPLLNGLAESQVFNSLPSGATGLTAYQNEVASLLKSGHFYGSDASADAQCESLVAKEGALSGVYGTASDVSVVATWHQENAHLAALVSALQATTISLENFDIASFFGSDLSQNEAKRVELYNLLQATNASDLLYPALASKVSSAIATIGTKLASGDLTQQYLYATYVKDLDSRSVASINAADGAVYRYDVPLSSGVIPHELLCMSYILSYGSPYANNQLSDADKVTVYGLVVPQFQYWQSGRFSS